MDRHDDVGRQLIRRLLLLLPGSLEKQCSWPSVAVAAIVMGLVSWITVSPRVHPARSRVRVD